MADYIINAAPMVIERGTEDLSTRQLPREPEALPQHLPKFFVFAQKGPTTPQLVGGNERINLFGSKTWDLRSAFATHQTVFANLVNAEGNNAMIQRLIPEDAGPLANVTLWLDVLPTTVDLYQRNSDGSIATDSGGSPIITGTADGFKIKWVKTFRATQADVEDFGTATIEPGDQTDPDTLVQSQRYPIYEFLAANIGAYGNNCGIRMWPLNKKQQLSYPSRMMAEERAFPFYFQAIRRDDALSSPSIVNTIFNDQDVMFVSKTGVIEPTTDQEVFMGSLIPSSYNNTTDLRYPPIFGDVEKVAIYQDNLGVLMQMFYDAEVPFVDQFSDITTDTGDIWLINHLTAMTSEGTPYHAIHLVDTADAIRWSEYTNVFMEGGSDGTMDNATLATLVSAKMQDYLDPANEVQDLAYHVESIIYDSGFPLETKYDLCNFIGVRRDTFVILSTYQVDGSELSSAEEQSVAIALRSRLQNFPESDYFGTPVMRGMVMGRSGKVRNIQYTKPLPLSAEVAIKSARYMGASNGRWKNGFNFDGAPGSIVDNMTDISIKWVPNSVRNRYWDVGLNWVGRYDRRSCFFPALKTIYNDDTSVLNSYFTAMAICYINKVAHMAWREFSGVSGLTNAQLEERVNTFVNNRLSGKFDGRFVIVPDAQHTDRDVLRGFSWTLPIKVFSSSLKTVLTTYVQAYRISDLGT